jgi:2-polyprenyl-3-methyl-5-hydroxy-6-metoxy-1,4-benzoquinol methylase
MNSIIKSFYDKNPFPGPYAISQLKNYGKYANPYISTIDSYLENGKTILDIGCGTGFISNLFALQYTSSVVGIDFSNGVNFGKDFAVKHNITNVDFIKEDFLNFKCNKKFDVIICQSVLNHMPDFDLAVQKIKNLLAPNGILLLGVYNKYGKLLQNILNVDYKNDRLKLDQESNPFEIAFSNRQIINMFSEYTMLKVTPSIKNRFVDFVNCSNVRNGGLTLYVFKSL